MDPWGADTNRSGNAAFQPKKFTSYERDGNGSDEAMFRRSNRWHSRFDQPDTYEGSYDSADPQSFNRYSYVRNDPVNFVDPSGLDGASAIGLPLPFLHGPGGYTVNVPISFGNGFLGGSENGTAGPYNPWADALPKGLWAQQGPLPGFDRDLGDPPPCAYVLLSQRDCANFIAELISIGASLSTSSTTPSFAPMMGPGGPEPSYTQYYAMDEYRKAEREGRVSASGVSGRVGDVLTYRTTTNHHTISWNREFYALGRDEAARQVIHESLHLVQGLTDFALAGAAHIMATRGLNNPGNQGSFSSQSAASQYLNQQIAQHCGGN
jgi:RHS repeat-associated protein